MKGYNTWIAIVGFVLLAVYDFTEGRTDEAFMKITAALGLFGIGRKIEKPK